MARGAKLLTAAGVGQIMQAAKRGDATVQETGAKVAGRHRDGDDLFLSVKGGHVSWTFMYRVKAGPEIGRKRELGLGHAGELSLASARKASAAARTRVAEGHDPVADRKRARAARPTFATVMDEWLASAGGNWSNAIHAVQVETTLRTYAAPLMRKRVDRIERADVFAVLKPIWSEKNETARRLRGRIEAVFDFAAGEEYRSDDNPAENRGALKRDLANLGTGTRRHHTALPWSEIPDLMRDLERVGAMSALALRWTILAACRTSETLNARWREIDMDAGASDLPRPRMKAREPHTVPLTPTMVAILATVRPLAGGDPDAFVFPARPSRETGEARPLSGMAMLQTMRRIGRMAVDADGTTRLATPHGTARAGFRTWVQEATSFPEHLAERQLAHGPRNKVLAAYERGQALERRREMMAAWDRFLSAETADVVVPLRAVSA